MKKRAFTMVELIFVIVILGILAAVAVPRLNASRDDAEITKFAANLATIYKDVQTYYLANGTVFTDETKTNGIAAITNVPLAKYNSVLHSLQIDGKNCLLIMLHQSTDYGEFIYIRRNEEVYTDNPMCVKMWEVFKSKPELKTLLDGKMWVNVETIYNITSAGIDNWAYRPIFRHKDGVEFE